MAKEHHINIPAHYNIYTGENTNRTLDIYFSEPENGVNKETGLLLLIPGFGGNTQSNVYKKMRLEFADKYNLVVIQADYFGSEFMQSSNRINLSFDVNNYKGTISKTDYNSLKIEPLNFNKIISVLSNYSSVLHATEVLDENVNNFNDMGFMQAMDLLTALYAVRLILEDNQLTFNNNKVITYGHSHGAYLSYLCNRLAPNDITFMIDNSAWLNPVYLNSSRYLNKGYGELILQTRFNYFARNYEYDKGILNLTKLYERFQNNSKIWSFQGITDNLVDYKEKGKFCKSIDGTTFHLIDEEKVDNKMFLSTGHGLNADFLKLFDFVIDNSDVSTNTKKPMNNDESTIILNGNKKYIVSFEKGLPTLSVDYIK